MKRNRKTAQTEAAPHGSQGQDTRARMIDAAIEVFGSIGYDGATTRQLAERAGVNQAAIPYHFGGKRKLYLAAAQATADQMRSRLEPLIDELRTAGVDPVGHIDTAVMRFFQFIAGDEQPDARTLFFMRCERDADEAFRIIHDRSVAQFQAALITAVAAATGHSPDDENLKVRVAVVLGAISNFRTLRNVLLTSLGWDGVNAARKQTVETAVRRLVLDQLLGDRPVAPSPRRAVGDIQTITFGPELTADLITRREISRSSAEWTKQKPDETAATHEPTWARVS